MIYLKQNKLNIIAAIVMTIALFVFFACIHPIIMFDTDDWTIFTKQRYPWPYWTAWNPIKVLPETLMPMMGYIAAYFVNPFVGDYINSVTYVSAFLVSISITITVFLLGVCTVKTLDMPAEKAYIFAIVSCLWGFGMFMFRSDINNSVNASRYLFLAKDLTCFYHYMLPALLNLSLVFYMMTKEDFPNIYNEMSGGKKGIFILICYLAICSNLFHNVILATYSGLQILYEFFRCKCAGFRKRIVENVKRCYVYYAIVVFWLALLPFEAYGGRANDIKISANIWKLLFRAFKNLQNIDLNILFLVYVGLLIIGIGITCYKNRSICFLKSPAAKKVFTDSLLCVVLIAIYIIILGARLNGDYVNLPSVQISFWMFVLLMLSLMLGYLIKELKTVRTLLPLFMFFMLMNVLDCRYNFQESTMGNVDPIMCKRFDYYLIEQIQAADKSGQKNIALLVPKHKSKTNFPHAVFAGNYIRRTLYRHGLISRNDINVKIEPVFNDLHEIINRNDIKAKVQPASNKQQLGIGLKSSNISTHIARIDIKNEGTNVNDVEIIKISDASAIVEAPEWMRKNGMGRLINGEKGELSFKLKCKGDGKLSISLRGPFVIDGYGERIPVWVNYSKFAVDGKTIFGKVKPAWHDKPQKVVKNVQDGQIVDVRVLWMAD